MGIAEACKSGNRILDTIDRIKCQCSKACVLKAAALLVFLRKQFGTVRLFTFQASLNIDFAIYFGISLNRNKSS